MKSSSGASMSHLFFRFKESENKWRRILILSEAILAALMVATIISVTPHNSDNSQAEAQAAETTRINEQIKSAEIVEIPDQVAIKNECAHAWAPITYTVEHPQVDHVVKHDPEYEMQTAYHTVCNECGKVIDGKAQAHIEKTGHCGFTREVPVTEKTLVKDGWIETVVDEKAWTETVIKGYECPLCNAKTDLLA